MKHLPNILSALRLGLAPVLVLVAATAQSRPWFLGLLGTALLTDALDGFLARRLHAQTELGRKLDSWADYATMIAVVAGLMLLWPEVVRREWLWFVAGVAGFFIGVVYSLVRWRQLLGYHTWLAKALAVAFPVALFSLIEGWSAVPFRVMAGLQLLGAFEELAISLLLPGYSGEMPTVFHAVRRRRDGRSERTSTIS